VVLEEETVASEDTVVSSESFEFWALYLDLSSALIFPLSSALFCLFIILSLYTLRPIIITTPKIGPAVGNRLTAD